MRELAAVRPLVLEAFDAIADICTVPRPDGAFYCLLRVHTAMDPLGTGGTVDPRASRGRDPGTAFGLARGCYLRVSYGALDKDTVVEGMSRLVDGLRAISTPALHLVRTP